MGVIINYIYFCLISDLGLFELGVLQSLMNLKTTMENKREPEAKLK